MNLPFDGAISRYFETEAPAFVRNAIRRAEAGEILQPGYPHSERLPRKAYERDLAALQIELAKLQAWVRATGSRVVCLFEGRDAAGKGGTIRRFREHLNPRHARVVALPAPSETEAQQWYFQRYIDHLPTGGEIVFYDRSWYNRGIVEHVFGFCTAEERDVFFRQVKGVERMLAEDGIHVFKFWLNIGRAEQLRRFLRRERDPLKQWKLSRIDVDGLRRWVDYTDAIGETLFRSHSDHAPWTVIRADDKRRARLESMRRVLSAIDYDHKDERAVGTIDGAVCGGPEIWDA